MAHLSENSKKLAIKEVSASNLQELEGLTSSFNDVCILRLPSCSSGDYSKRLKGIGQIVADIGAMLGPEATLITLGEVIDLVAVQAAMPPSMRYQSWIAIKRTPQITNGSTSLPRHHFGALIHTRYDATLRHTKTRLGYTYCPACDKTTKDYGGKKHTYHEYGTAISDVWRDVTCELDGDLSAVTERFADFFGIEQYRELRVIDCRKMPLKRQPVTPSATAIKSAHTNPLPKSWSNKLAQGDVLKKLRKIPENSIDFAFADPPYNLKKGYTGYTDDLAITEYFTWCDEWLSELARVLKPGRTCAILNIPLYAVRHFFHLETILNFQNWVAWDALSFPVRQLMPSHYSILLFSKGDPRPLPGIINGNDNLLSSSSLLPLAEGFCLRAQCVEKRKKLQTDDRGTLTDIWWDIHRLKHNTRRVDHPCQLPPQLMYRLISLLTEPQETVLDCFNGAGTTTLTAHQLGRNYIGIEKEATYHQLTESRHDEVRSGLDPFRKAERELTAKNSPVPRMLKQKYEVPKKTLQLEVRRVAKKLKRLPNRDELAQYGKYPIEFYDNYFTSWGEVCAAARTTGMTEDRVTTEEKQLSFSGIE
jgi:site-specific DNA-methyltransferase (adenine-specific)